MSRPEQPVGLSPALRQFLAEPAEGRRWPPATSKADLAGRELYVEEPLLGQPSSRFVKEGGVRLNRVTHYALTPEDLPPMFRRRPGLTRVKLVLLKFWLMFDELPPNREYMAIRIRVSLQPPAPVLLLRPDATASQADPAQAPGAVPADLARLLRSAASQAAPAGASQPAATAIDLGAEGFGWTYQARGGAPLGSRREITLAMLELPADATTVAGLLDAEAQVSQRLLGTAKRRRAAPVNSAAPFTVPLEYPD
jgi:hypothetical protein